ncbi:amidophosphoribosyltransferase [Faecalibaculum rodentium]|uniref:Amidophosphoribosyltransferase n=1 Tax=Faecalibaculum rodentium TaxID=1702221 RepID=A0A140DT95_9FIRM|nr:amidophosphoribosyltransferase [Faecalibaculum rodentium]AMK53872.1 amidophosphoribosyltransferase [Faecalibaculum rodentium]
MSGFFGVASTQSCVLDLFFGTDYHSHLGTRRAGMAVYGKEHGFERAIHNIENTPFRTKFDRDLSKFRGNLGIGCISDFEAQPLLMHSHLGSFAITTVGRINNLEELKDLCFQAGMTHFLEMSSGGINPTELVAALISLKDSFLEGLQFVQEKVKGSLSVLLLTPEGLWASRDRLGRTPVIVGHKESGYCVTFESSAFLNLGYEHVMDLGPGEIVFVTPERLNVMQQPQKDMRICSFLWVYYGYPTSTYEGVNVEVMRNRCGQILARRDATVDVDSVAGVPDSGTAHAVGYANEKQIPFSRPFIKYTPTWPRSFMPTDQSQRSMIAKMKLIPVKDLIRDQRLLLIDDSIVRGTQLGETTEFLYHSGAREVHVRPACPPIMYGCKYLNFSRSTSDYDLITRRVIRDLEGGEPDEATLKRYADPDTPEYAAMCEEIRRRSDFTTLRYHRLDDMIESIGLPRESLCTYCWNGEE